MTLTDDRLNVLVAEKHELIRRFDSGGIDIERFESELKRLENGLNRLRLNLEALDKAKREGKEWTKNGKIDYYKG